MRPRIMYIECKADGLNGKGRIGRVSFSKTGRTLFYGGKAFKSLVGKGYKANYYDIETGEHYWISGPKKHGGDRLYGAPGIDIDDDVKQEYWLTIRDRPGQVSDKTA